VLPAGHIPPNPTELLSSPRLHDILEVLEQYFDYIFIDTPPIGAVTDTALLIPEMHGHIFVVRAGETRKEGLKRAVDTMEQLGANILGFVLNDYDPRKSHHSYGYYGKSRGGYKYDKYGHYGYGRKQQGSNKENEVKNENREIYSGIKSDQDKSE
jgi:capsular exopolysaccharide family